MIDENRLDELERNLAEARRELEEARFNERYANLEYALIQQERWIGTDGTFFIELQLLKDDVENVRIINETIPRTCFKTIEIEPTS